ncbi:MAG: CPBP family intramembrane metalloprotease [Treponema sp.]|nr:CPBP family intramembrane metalloprotease [Treponema sp.]
MKKGFFATEFAAVLLFFVLPPLFAPSVPQGQTMHFSWMTFALAALALMVWMQTRELSEHTRVESAGFLVCQAQCLMTFGALMASAGVSEAVARFALRAESVRFLPPRTLIGWLNIMLGIPCAAFYEEVLYRAYLPAAIRRVFPPAPPFAGEAFAVLVFALAHRTSGWLSVAHAAIAGALLRRCFCKTARLWTNVAAHTAYNAIMTALTFVL